MNLTGFALRNQPLLFMIVLAFVLFGLSATQNFPSQEDPPIMVREAVITTFYPGMDPVSVERIVTREVEKALARITERKHITSYSWPGHSQVHIEIQDHYTNLDEIWSGVRDKIDDVRPRLPDGVIGPFVNDDFGDVTVMSIALLSDGFTLAQMYGIAKDVQRCSLGNAGRSCSVLSRVLASSSCPRRYSSRARTISRWNPSRVAGPMSAREMRNVSISNRCSRP